MDEPHDAKPRTPPVALTIPSDPAERRRVAILRLVVLCVLAAMLIFPVVQFQHSTMKYHRKRLAAAERGEVYTKTKGAIGRWRYAVRDFWAGHNIYLRETPGDVTRLHPNMPFTVILLSPFAYLPLWAGTALYNVLKVLAVVAAAWMMLRVANHHRLPVPDWAAALALLWAAKPIIGDIQHGNTNVFVMAAVVGHLWLYRRGRDLAAGAALAVAICLKMTPALFVLYWLYQRSWKVLATTLAALVVFAAVVPAVAVGPRRATELTRTWMDNLIVPGLLEGDWYPVHVNQSVSGVLGRYLLGEGTPGGNIYWNPDDYRYEDAPGHEWIAFVSLTPAQAKLVVRVVQGVLVVLMGWAIGWRRLPRTDGRRALHYGLVVVGMMLLNQRTWDHHATVLLVASVGIWQAIARGRASRALRRVAAGLMGVAMVLLWGSSNGVFKAVALLSGRDEDVGETWADLAAAYGPVFYHFLMYFIAGVLLAVALRKAEPTYAVPLRTVERP